MHQTPQVRFVGHDLEPLSELPLRWGDPMTGPQQERLGWEVQAAVEHFWPETADALPDRGPVREAGSRPVEGTVGAWLGHQAVAELVVSDASKSLASTLIHAFVSLRESKRSVAQVLSWADPVLRVHLARCVDEFGPYTDSPQGHAADGEPHIRARDADRLVCFDVETTGLPHDEDAYGAHRVIEIAMTELDPRSLEIGRSVSQLIAPERPNSAVVHNNITDGMLVGEPLFADVAPAVAAFIDGAVLVAHNLAFDQHFLAAEFGWANLHFSPGRGLCTYQATKTNLAQAGRNLGLELRNAHRAAGDTELLAQLACCLGANGRWLDSLVVPASALAGASSTPVPAGHVAR